MALSSQRRIELVRVHIQSLNMVETEGVADYEVWAGPQLSLWLYTESKMC